METLQCIPVYTSLLLGAIFYPLFLFCPACRAMRRATQYQTLCGCQGKLRIRYCGALDCIELSLAN